MITRRRSRILPSVSRRKPPPPTVARDHKISDYLRINYIR
jgi:hypothetical protein